MSAGQSAPGQRPPHDETSATDHADSRRSNGVFVLLITVNDPDADVVLEQLAAVIHAHQVSLARVCSRQSGNMPASGWQPAVGQASAWLRTFSPEARRGIRSAVTSDCRACAWTLEELRSATAARSKALAPAESGRDARTRELSQPPVAQRRDDGPQRFTGLREAVVLAT